MSPYPSCSPGQVAILSLIWEETNCLSDMPERKPVSTSGNHNISLKSSGNVLH